MQFYFAPKGPVSLQSLRKSSGRKNTLRTLIYLTLLATIIASFLELKAIHRLLNQVHTHHIIPVLNIKESAHV